MKKTKNKKVVLIDGHNIAYRAFYAVPDSIYTSSGILTNAVMGFTSMLLKLIEDQHPDNIICTFDSKIPTFRHEMYKQYKIHRKKMPDELSNQFPLIKEVLDAFNIVYLEEDGFEADDIIAGLVENIKDFYDQIIIVTGDKDILQLVSDNVRVMTIKKGITETVIFDPKMVEEKFGVRPERVKDLLALMGDNSDNIPGIPGVGPKTAKLLVKKYGSLEGIYEHIEKVDNQRLRNLLIDNKKEAQLSKELATLKLSRNMDTAKIINNSFKNISFKKIKQLFNSLEFRSLDRKLTGLKDKINFMEDNLNDKKKTGKIKLKHLTENLKPDVPVKSSHGNLYIVEFIDKEKLYGFILYFGGESAFLVKNGNLDENTGKKWVKNLIEDEKIKKSGFNFKKIYKILKDHGISLRGELVDYEILYLILNPFKSATSPEEVISDILDIRIEDVEFSEGRTSGDSIKLKKIEKEKQLRLDFHGNKGPEAELETSSKDEALKKISLYKEIEFKLLNRIKKEELDKLYCQIEEPLIRILADMEYTGVNIDKKYLDDLISEYDFEIKKIKKEIYGFCGEKFNINSSQQLAEILYKKLKLPVTKKTKTGFSTDAATLKSIYGTSPVIKKILDYREKTKLKNTYIDVLPGLMDPKDSRVHTTYNQLGTSTGRISSSEPNLQNIPVRTDYGKQIRKAFIPGRGYDLILASDYSQIELRVLAHLSADNNLIDSFSSEEDIHTRTASELFGVSYEAVDDVLRRKAKAINFGIIYGMTEYGLMNRLSISEEEAREYIRKYFEKYSGVKRYLKTLIEDARKKGYSTTIFGRKRYIKELGSSNNRIRNLGERFAINTPIQGSAADIMKLSTIMLFKRLKSDKIDSNIILHVHDELVLELMEKDLEKIKKIVIESMENCITLKVKLKVDIKTGRNWYI